jgi:hypothetical protein
MEKPIKNPPHYYRKPHSIWTHVFMPVRNKWLCFILLLLCLCPVVCE